MKSTLTLTITEVAKDINAIAALGLNHDWEVYDAIIQAYLEAAGLRTTPEFDTDLLNAKHNPLSRTEKWLTENVVEFRNQSQEYAA